MTWLAQIAREYPEELHATMRERFGVSWAQAGQPSLPWREVLHLVRAAVADSSTTLGAAVAGWAYPARYVDLVLILAVGGKAAQKVMPYELPADKRHEKPREKTPADDLEAATKAAEADMAAMITFAS